MAKHLLASPAAVVRQIEVVGSDLDGQQYMERTHTLSITRDGATILLANKLAPESELLVRNLQTDEEAIVRVVGHIREDASGHMYGVALLDPSVDLWHVQFPCDPIGGLPFGSPRAFSVDGTQGKQVTDAPKPALWRRRVEPAPAECGKRIVLECSRCHAVRAVTLTEIEMAVFESKRALTRHCECGSLSTIWKETTRDVAAEPQRTSPQESPGPEPVAPLSPERRKHKRTAMKPAACIRCAGQEEVVACEDMSRGGFRFKSRKEYAKGVQVEAAVPYMQSIVNIFVSAQIVYHQELSAGSHRHGVCYVKMAAKSDLDA